MKFVTMQDEKGNETLYMFPKLIGHDAFAENVDSIRNQTYGNWERIFRQPISAGFVDRNWKCYGRSESLNLGSRPEDTELLKKQMGIY
ncbi:MAG: hypothetical protein ACXW2E_01830 [Nitrososphaeraceae archaeon]